MTLWVVNLYLDRGDASTKDAQLLSGSPREIDDSSAAKRTTVVDLHHDNPVVVGIKHPEQRAERMFLVGTGETVVMQTLTTRRQSSRGPFPIVGGNAFFYFLSME